MDMQLFPANAVVEGPFGGRPTMRRVDHRRPERASNEDADRDLKASVRLLTIPEAAEQLGISRSKLYELIADGELPTIRIGRARRIATRDLVRFVAERRTVG